MSYQSTTHLTVPYSDNSQQYQSPSTDYSMNFYELLLCDNPLETDPLDNSTDWNSIQSFGAFSSDESFSSFAAIDSELDIIPQSYSNLWEIQLELGEIPDMISNNLLEPCPLSSFTRHALHFSRPCDHVEITGLEQKIEDEIEEELEKGEKEEGEDDNDDEGDENQVWPSEVSIKSEPPVRNKHLLPTMYSFSYKTGPTTGVDQEQEYGDGEELEGGYDEEEDEEEDSRWDVAVNHPVYGMLSSSFELRGGEFRHDRKDSGVFMHGDRDYYMEERPSGQEDDLKDFPVAVEHRDACQERHGSSAAYKSLQRIALNFSSLSL
ncbi:hypothetical protein BGX27_009178 [Mortierella sp. AM989]|nr:hypothetical protein BGX27_009178 [Mortierella sp. AM989]